MKTTKSSAALVIIVFAFLLSSGFANAADTLYGLFYNGASGSGDSMTLATVSTVSGHATPLFSFVTLSHGFSGASLAFDKDSNSFAAAGFDLASNTSTLLKIKAFDPGHPTPELLITGLPSGFNKVYGVEYVPAGANTRNTTNPPGTSGLYVSHGPNNSNLNDRIAQVDITTGAVVQDVTGGAGHDIDCMDYNPATEFLTITDSNEQPTDSFREINGNIFASPSYSVQYATPPLDGTYQDGAFSGSDTYYVGNSDSYLWKLEPGGTSYTQIGPFDMGTSVAVGLAYAVPEPATLTLLVIGSAGLLVARGLSRKMSKT